MSYISIRKRRGLGQDCPTGEVYTASVGACVDDISGALDTFTEQNIASSPGMTQAVQNAGGTGEQIESSLESLGMPASFFAASTSTSGSLVDWINQNGEVVVVACAVIGALIALTRMGR
jgi:hypothetical protein